MIEVIKQLVDALEWCYGGEPVNTAEAIKVGKQAIAELGKHKCTYPDCSYPCPDLPDCIDAKKQEPVAWMDIGDKGEYYSLRFWSEPDNRNEVPLYTYPQPKQKSLTLEQLREHWQVAKVLDMTDAEIDFADYVLIARDIEALYGIKGEA